MLLVSSDMIESHNMECKHHTEQVHHPICSIQFVNGGILAKVRRCEKQAVKRKQKIQPANHWI